MEGRLRTFERDIGNIKGATMEQCTAHGLVIETVQGLRENQKETYTLMAENTHRKDSY